jgi:hypothetical protein
MLSSFRDRVASGDFERAAKVTGRQPPLET